MLKTRIITALILAPIAIGGIFFLPPLGFALFTGAIITLGAWEWANMAGLTSQAARIGYAAAIAAVLFGLLHVPALAVFWLALVWWVVCLQLVRQLPGGFGALGVGAGSRPDGAAGAGAGLGRPQPPAYRRDKFR